MVFFGGGQFLNISYNLDPFFILIQKNIHVASSPWEWRHRWRTPAGRRGPGGAAGESFARRPWRRAAAIGEQGSPARWGGGGDHRIHEGVVIEVR